MYKLNYNNVTGKVNTISRENSNGSIIFFYPDSGNPYFQEFLKWNSKQSTPLDLKSTIPVVPPSPSRDLAKEIDALKLRVTTLEPPKFT